MIETLVIDLILLTLVVFVAAGAVLVRNLLGTAALMAIYSLLMALVWANMYALDVAFTEAAVGAGISTILLIGALVVTGTKDNTKKAVNWPALLIVGITGLALGYGTIDMPAFGDPDAPIHNRVFDGYSQQDVGKPQHGVPGAWDGDVQRDPRSDERGHQIDGEALTGGADLRGTPRALGAAEGDHEPDKGAGGEHDDGAHAADTSHAHRQDGDHGDFSHHAPNLVTAVLASYRGYDTMFETAVIFTAGISVILLLRRREDKPQVIVAAGEHPPPADAAGTDGVQTAQAPLPDKPDKPEAMP